MTGGYERVRTRLGQVTGMHGSRNAGQQFAKVGIMTDESASFDESQRGEQVIGTGRRIPHQWHILIRRILFIGFDDLFEINLGDRRVHVPSVGYSSPKAGPARDHGLLIERRKIVTGKRSESARLPESKVIGKARERLRWNQHDDDIIEHRAGDAMWSGIERIVLFDADPRIGQEMNHQGFALASRKLPGGFGLLIREYPSGNRRATHHVNRHQRMRNAGREHPMSIPSIGENIEWSS